MMENLIEAKCYWCAVRITRVNENLAWIDDYESAMCEDHPAFKKVRDFSAPHQTQDEVEDIIANHQVIRLAQRDKTKRLRAVDSNVVAVGRNAQRTSRSAAEGFMPRAGSVRKQVLELVRAKQGLTDYELEVQLQIKHQTVSSSRRSLVIDGFLVDSGTTRKNPQGNDCIIWVTNELHNGMLFG